MNNLNNLLEAAAVALSLATGDTIAITNVNVLAMTANRVDSAQTVVIAGDRIIAVGPVARISVPPGARRVDGRGRFLLPGLVDMHVHMTTAAELPMYVGYGVLTVRDLNGSPHTLAWRDSIQRGLILGPRIYTSGPMLAGRAISWRNKVTPSSAAEAIATVREQKRLGYDQVKLYDGLSREVFAAAVGEAKRLGMQSSSHVPQDVGFAAVLQSGVTSLEHLDKTLFNVLGHAMDTLRLPSIAAQIRQAGVWVTPTLASMVELSHVGSGRYDSLMARPAVQSSPPELRDFWQTITARIRGDRPLAAGSKYNPWTTFQMQFARELLRAGVPMLAGSDLPNAVLVPGLALHEELVALTEAGFAAYQAIEAATSAPARFLGQAADWGTVAVGQRANLLLVGGDPRGSLGVLAAPDGIMVAGKWIDREALASMRRQER